MTRTYWAHALNRRGRTIGKVGPFASREAALAEIRFMYPQARGYTVGYGTDDLYFDIRHERA